MFKNPINRRNHQCNQPSNQGMSLNTLCSIYFGLTLSSISNQINGINYPTALVSRFYCQGAVCQKLCCDSAVFLSLDNNYLLIGQSFKLYICTFISTCITLILQLYNQAVPMQKKQGEKYKCDLTLSTLVLRKDQTDPGIIDIHISKHLIVKHIRF